MLYQAYYDGGVRVVDVSGELMGNLADQGREIAVFKSFDPTGYTPNAAFVMNAMPWKGLRAVHGLQQRVVGGEAAAEDRGAVTGRPYGWQNMTNGPRIAGRSSFQLVVQVEVVFERRSKDCAAYGRTSI